MEHYQSMVKIYSSLAVLCGIGALVFTFLANNCKDKINAIKKEEKPIIINNDSHDTYNVNKSKNTIIGNNNNLIINESLEQQRINKIKEAVTDLHTDDVQKFEKALNYLKANPEFTDKQIQEIFEILKLRKFRNTYLEELESLLTHRESSIATKHFGESLRGYFYTPSIPMQYFSKNNVDFEVFSNYLKEPIKLQADKSTIPSVVVNNCANNKKYILKFLNSKDLMDLMFKDIHPNYIQNLKMNFEQEILYHISKDEYENSYYYKVVSKLRNP